MTGRQRLVLYGLLLLVAAAAAVLSFAALRDLALVCGFAPALAWLLPVTIDAGAAAGSIVWLAGWTPAGARSYGRALAVALLASSVGGNALGHGLAAYAAHPHWLVVVGVSAIAPAVLGALVHLVVLVGRPVVEMAPPVAEPGLAPVASPGGEAGGPEPGDPGVVVAGDEPGVHASPVHLVPALAVDPGDHPPPARAATPRQPTSPPDADQLATVARLVANGAGRKRIAVELAVSEHEARTLIGQVRQGVAQ